AKVVVFEHLRRYRPPKEKMSRSGRKNHKRVYWLRGQILEWVRDPSGKGFCRSSATRPIPPRPVRTAGCRGT
ncbi:MAG: hypothetical protein QJR01_02035, partial [Kyrpidia sp.]|nr:hypothetical protein [Kyrpidia sp.]